MPSRFPWKAAAVVGAILGTVGLIVAARSRQAPATRRVALIGDSYAVGLGPELAKLFPEFQYEGHVGTKTWEWANQSLACGNCGDWIAAYKPDVVLVSLGVNDSSSSNKGHYQSIVKSIQNIGSRVVWIEPPASVQTPARKMIAALGVQTIQSTTTPLAADGLHPASYAPWAAEIARAIRV